MNFYDEPKSSFNPYQSYPFYPFLPWADETTRDRRRFQELYPAMARKIQPLVEEACDRMEYDGSFMFDEYPDRYSVKALCRKIYKKLTEQEELQGMACEQDSLYQLIEVMMIQEIFKRRCRYRRCRRWY